LADVRYCHIKKDLLGIQTAGLSLSGSEWSSLAEMGSGLYRRGQAMGEGETVWSLIICDHQMNKSTCLASWVIWSSWVVLQTEKQSGRKKQGVINQGVWFRC
jgi:hypothetical protein